MNTSPLEGSAFIVDPSRRPSWTVLFNITQKTGSDFTVNVIQSAGGGEPERYAVKASTIAEAHQIMANLMLQSVKQIMAEHERGVAPMLVM